MGSWIANGRYYLVEKSELDYDKAKEFADKAVNKNETLNNTYNTYGYEFQRRYENVLNGKLSENAVKVFLKEVFNYDLEINYDIYPGVLNVDENDFEAFGYSFDIKSSRDNDNRGLKECLKSFNFPVPVKKRNPLDFTIGVIYNNEATKWILVSWIDKDTYLNKCKKAYWPNEKMYWYKLSYQEGYSIKDLAIFFDSKNKFIEFIRNNNKSETN